MFISGSSLDDRLLLLGVVFLWGGNSSSGCIRISLRFADISSEASTILLWIGASHQVPPAELSEHPTVLHHQRQLAAPSFCSL